jgi:hypothetical protein
MRPAAPPAQNWLRRNKDYSILFYSILIQVAAVLVTLRMRGIKIFANNHFCVCGQLLLPFKIQVAAVLVTLRMRGMKVSANIRFCVCGQLLFPLKIQVATVLVTLRMRGKKISANNRFLCTIFSS